MKVKPHHLRSHGHKPKKPYMIKDELKRKNMELVIENMKTEEIVLIRQVLMTNINSLEVRLEGTVTPFCQRIIENKLKQAKKAYEAALRLI